MGLQGTLLNTVTFSELTDLIRKSFVQTQMTVKPAASSLFITQPIANGNGNTKRFDEIDTETFGRTKRQGEAAKKASVGIGYNVTMTKKRIAIEIDITQEMRDENRYAEVGSLITDLSKFCPNRIDLDMTHILTFSGATSYVDMDGETVDVAVGDNLSLINNAHTLLFSSTTYSNRVPGDPVFSRGGIEAAELLTTTNILSNFGERRVISFNTIVTGDDPNTVNAVKQFLQSTADVDQNNSGVVNVYKNKYRHLVLPYLATTATSAYDSTKARYWFLAALGNGTQGLQAYYGEWEAPHLQNAPTEGSNMVDPHRDIWSFGARAGYGLRVVSGRGIVGAFPASN